MLSKKLTNFYQRLVYQVYQLHIRYIILKITIDWLSRKESDDKSSYEVSVYVENISR